MPYSALRDKQNELIRKSIDGSVLIAPRTVANLASITTGAGSTLVTLPTGWEDIGWTSSDGVTFGREIESSDVTSFGSTEPTRSDIVSDVSTMQVVAQETKLLTLGLYINIDTSAVEAGATTGELRIAKPTRAASRHYRVLALFVDETDDGEIYMARYFPNAKITERSEMTFANGDDAVSYGLTFTAFDDAAAGASEEWLFGGPGWVALLDQMNVTQAT